MNRFFRAYISAAGWTAIALLMSLAFLIAGPLLAQSVTISSAVFTGAGLNDATSGGAFSTAPTNAVYKVVICTAATPDTAKYQKNGGTFSSCVPITGAAQALSDGVTIRFAATTGHTVGNFWTITATTNGTVAASNFIARPSGSVFRSAQDKLREVVSVKDFGAKGDGVHDDTSALLACIAYSATNTASCFVPAGTYLHTGLTITGGYRLIGESEFTSILLYSGSGAALTLNTPSGFMGYLAIRSTTGYLAATYGIDMQNATEFGMSNLYFGGGPTSGFNSCFRARATGGAVLVGATFSWCQTGFYAALDASANSGVVIRDAAFFLMTNAAIQLADAGAFRVEDSYFEAVQNAVLVDNGGAAAVATGEIEIAHNRALLLTSSSGLTFTDPQFLFVNGRNITNSIALGAFHLSKNTVICSGGAYCNTLTKAGSVAGGSWNLFFTDNVWQNVATAVVTGDLASVYVLAQNETRPASIPEFAGGMAGSDSAFASGGNVTITPYYGAYYSPFIPPSGSIASAASSFTANFLSQVVKCNSTASADATVNLAPFPVTGQVITVKKIDAAAHNCIIAPNGNNLDGSSASVNLSQNYGYGTFWFDGTEWWTLEAGVNPSTVANLPIYHPTPPGVSACGTGAAIGANSNDRAGGVVIGSTVPTTACTITFGNSFAVQPWCSLSLAFNAGSAVLTGFPGSNTAFTIQGTALQNSTITWTCPIGN